MNHVRKTAVEPETSASSQTARATLSLREMILQGRFPPGERIREIPLAEDLGVSRIPLRIALERLEHEGLLEIRNTRGFVVPQFSIGDIHDAIELRGTLEGTAARFAAERLQDPGTLDPLRESCELMEQLARSGNLSLDNFSRYIDLNARFHEALLNLSGSRILRRAMQHARSLPFASPSAFVMRQHTLLDSQQLFLIAVDQHRGIVESIAHREGSRAEALAREHARVARQNLEITLKDRGLLQLLPGGKLIKI
jgi:GntR family transcriptional regulator, vanillate catabolism transcriptional regulator